MIVARINEDSELFIRGNLEEGYESISLEANGDLKVKKVYTKLDAIDDVETIDSDHVLDEDTAFSDDDSIENFFAFFFGIEMVEVSPNVVQFDKSENIIANNVIDNQNLGDD